LLPNVRQGFPPTRTVGAPGVQVPAITGMQGWGVRTPRAAAVAAATWGFDGVVHIPKGVMFTMGAASVIVSAGLPPTNTVKLLVEVKFPGVVPKVHMQVPPIATIGVITIASSRSEAKRFVFRFPVVPRHLPGYYSNVTPSRLWKSISLYLFCPSTMYFTRYVRFGPSFLTRRVKVPSSST